MGIRAYVQVKQPEYGNCCLSSWAREKAYDYLVCEQELNVFTDDNGNGSYSDKWEVEITDRTRIAGVIADLRENPNCLDDKENGGRKYALDLANLLEEGLEVADKNNYDFIIIEWF